MYRLRTTTAAIVTTFALGSFAAAAVPSAFADDGTDAACATKQAHADRATAKLAALTAKFAAHPTKKNHKAKKAQVQRVAHATSRLSACLVAHSS